MALNDVIKDARLKKNLKQEEAAKLVGVTVQTYSKWENGKTEPKASQVGKLSQILGISTNAICKGQIDEQMDPMEFMRTYSKIAKTVGHLDEMLVLYEVVEDQQAFFEKLRSYSEFPDDVIDMDLPEGTLQDALAKSKKVSK